ncbi:hypothetical protein DL98DRAFT_614614 [Cadophora sp. DSE1049]|nr:hypothetical protein DL98DRAFT_614614 [Cadophora sp. DSE1049]
MAAPPTKTLNDLDGVWTLNKRLSDPFDEVLAIQGIGWILRKTIGLASTTERIRQSRDEHGIEHIIINTTITGGIKTTPEHRIHNDTWGEEYSDPIFGKSRSRHRRVKISALKEDDLVEGLLKKGWTEEVVKADELIDGIVESLNHGWVLRLTCGFEDINGERRFVRRMIVTKEGQVRSSRMVFDFTGPLSD